jgi:hypothetical protein
MKIKLRIPANTGRAARMARWYLRNFAQQREKYPAVDHERKYMAALATLYGRRRE